MNPKIEIFQLDASSDDLKLSVAALDVEHPKAVIQLVHGMCEHKERYFSMMEFLAEKGFVTVIHDHRGHGASVRSTGDLGYAYDGGYLAAVEDVRLVTLWAKRKYSGIPVILFGHSMGSMVVRSYTKRYDDEIAGLVVCGSPSRNPAAGFGKALARVCEFFCGGHSRPKLIQKLAFGPYGAKFPEEMSPNSWICSDPSVVEAYDTDPLCSYQFTANGFKNLFALMQDAYSPKGWKMSDPSLPILFIAGSDDPCITDEVKFTEAVDFMRKVGYRNVRSKLYGGLRHEIHNETSKDVVWNDVASFASN